MTENIQMSEIVSFYTNSHILITGGTGFLGRVLINKLLTSCTSLNQIYLIIRVKRGQNPRRRFEELLDDPLFSNLKGKVPNLESKITLIHGDCSLPGLGLLHCDREFLKNKLTHVFHAAATVNFDEKLKTAIETNVLGVDEVLGLCRDCEQLKSIVYVSSTYAHCIRESVEETFYDVPIRSTEVIHLVNNLTDDRLEQIKNGLITPWPNAYNFSKAIAEDLIKTRGTGLPIGIFRPSIVIGASEEPVPGWINNFYGPTGVVAGVGSGLLRVLKVDKTMRADLVPVDMAVNALICAAWDIHQNMVAHVNAKSNENINTQLSATPIIYNFVTTKSNPITWNDYLQYSMKHGMKIPPRKAIWYITLTITKRETIYKVLIHLYHILPALIIDGWLRMTGKNERMLKTYRKIHKFSNVISYFTTRQWSFPNKNVQKLWYKLNDTDKSLFNFNTDTLNWDDYFKKTVFGLRKYLFRDEPSTIPMARKRMFLLYVCHRALQASAMVIFFWIVVQGIGKGLT